MAFGVKNLLQFLDGGTVDWTTHTHNTRRRMRLPCGVVGALCTVRSLPRCGVGSESDPKNHPSKNGASLKILPSYDIYILIF